MSKESGKKTAPTWRPHRFAGVIVVCVIVYALLGFLLVPWLAERTAVREADAALGLDLRIGGISFNPFTFVADIRGVEAGYASGHQLADIESILVNLQASALLGGRVVITEARIDGIAVTMRRDADGQIDIATLAAAEPQDLPLEPAKPGWPLLIETLLVEDMSVEWIDESIAPAAQLGIDDLRLEATDVSTVPETSFRPTCCGRMSLRLRVSVSIPGSLNLPAA